MSITNRHEGFTLLEVIISLGISMSLLLIIIKVNSEVINDYCSNSKESILEDNFDNAMLNLDNIINGYEVSDIKAENNQIIIKYDLDFEKDYYKILGVEKNASSEEIKKAYHQLAHKYHPDKAGGDEKKFKEINEAYQTLSDSEKRKQYDFMRKYGYVGAGSSRNRGADFNFDFWLINRQS